MVEHLKGARNSKLRKTLSNEKRFLDLAKEDVTLKKKMMEEIKEMNKDLSSQMTVLTNT